MAEEIKIEREICPRCKTEQLFSMWGKGKCYHCGYYFNPKVYGKSEEQVKAFNESPFVEGENQDILSSQMIADNKKQRSVQELISNDLIIEE